MRRTQRTPYMFSLAVAGLDLSDEATVEALVSGGPEVYPAVVAGVSTLTYRVDADNAHDAVTTAVAHVRSLFPAARVRRVELDLVSISNIASRLARPRESVRAWVVGTRGPGDFPVPLAVVGDGVRVWDWPSVNAWLRRERIAGHDQEHLLTREEIDEVNVALARAAQGPAESRDHLRASGSTAA